MIAALKQRLAHRAPNLTTAAWFYRFLVAQQRDYARAGRDDRHPRDLVSPSPTGAVLRFRDYGLADVRFHFGEMAAIQKLDEVMQFLDRVAAISPRAVCEIGTSSGGMLYLLTRVAAEDAILVSVDLEIQRHVAAARARLARRGQQVVSVSGDSHDERTRGRVVAALAGRPLDVLFIDGDHAYEGVRRDWDLYSPLVRSGGLIGLHDIQDDYETSRGIPTPANSGEVPRFWRELREGRSIEEFVVDPEQDGYGIGVVYV